MPGGGRLTVTTTAVDIDADDAPTPELEAGAYVCLAVRDTGVGMSEDVQAQIFDPFFTTKEEGKGTGLGLSIVYGIIKQSGGAITVCSTVGEGTRIAVYFKRVDPDSAPARRSAPRNRPARGAETVLLVEDQAAVRAVVREALESFGYLVLEAGCPIEALRLASEYEGGIDALLTDAVMPKMSGRELAERLVAERPAMRVLYMSGHTRDVMLRQGVSAGAVAFLSKPFTPSELADRLRALLDE
jgi:two-component system cell cycle sensor histidine kinase/response regulator CckA